MKKLEELRNSILQDTPDANVVCSTDYDRLLGEMDMIVTSTSGAGKKILDITKVKPGCVITDVARPLDLPPEEVAKRPDVLVVESGEIELPTTVRGMKSIGLPPNVIYACLAETIVLALEGRFEVFTIGRDTEWEKVKEIYKLGLKHGMKLAAISGVNGVFTDEDIAKVVELARKARRTWKGAASAPAGRASVRRRPTRAAGAGAAEAAPAERRAATTSRRRAVTQVSEGASSTAPTTRARAAKASATRAETSRAPATDGRAAVATTQGATKKGATKKGATTKAATTKVATTKAAN
jgi:hypothetical protein